MRQHVYLKPDHTDLTASERLVELLQQFATWELQ